jgi:hypothetical protein
MNEKTARQLAINLLGLMRTGSDARTQIDFICNSMRIKNKEAAHLQKIFESGIHAGCNAVIKGETISSQDSQSHPLHVAAYHLGRKDFEIKLEEQHHKHKPKGGIAGYGLIRPAVLILAIILAALLARL